MTIRLFARLMNFLCISNYNNDLDWVKDYPNPHLIYDKTWSGGVRDNDNSARLPPSRLQERYPSYRITNGSPNGYNISDYMSFIIDHYERLPDVVAFVKGNVVPRHVSRAYFDRVINSPCFTPIEDWRAHNLSQLSLLLGRAMFSCEGGWMERNTSWYLRHAKHPTKYFRSYNDFLRFCFKDPVLPKYVRFPPGGNFVVPRDYILKYDRVFYENLRTFTDHSRVSGEGQMIERALFTIWTCNFEVADTMKCRVCADQPLSIA